jgi:GT2 family glycosyltransferase
MMVDVLVLNYNGRELLAECLPSVLRAAEVSRHDCRVAVVDNSSSDGSQNLLAQRFPQVPLSVCKNRGLCSFNTVLARLQGQVAVLLNNDIKLAEGSIDPLVAPLFRRAGDGNDASDMPDNGCFLTAPLCWQFDGRTYDGQKTAVRWRWGLVQATWQFPGHEGQIHRAGWTASAGAAIAVDRLRFLELGGFDPRFLPGRLEDLDLAYRGYLAGYHARYVPESVAYHRGEATFAKVFDRGACDRLTLRNTLLFQWKHLRHPRHWARQVAGYAARLARDVLTAPFQPRERRLMFIRAFCEAWERHRASGESICATKRSELDFFRRFHPRSFALTR